MSAKGAIMNVIEIDLGDYLPKDMAFVDIETRKVPVPVGFVHLLPSGHNMKVRWQPFLI
jgi:hypothetical protein